MYQNSSCLGFVSIDYYDLFYIGYYKKENNNMVPNP